MSKSRIQPYVITSDNNKKHNCDKTVSGIMQMIVICGGLNAHSHTGVSAYLHIYNMYIQTYISKHRQLKESKNFEKKN